MKITVTGGAQLEALARDLAAGGVRFRTKLRRNMAATSAPIVSEVQRGYRGAPASGDRSTGLREALANATRMQLFTGLRDVVVRIMVDPARMPATQQGLPTLVEGERPWHHGLFGNQALSFVQSPFPEFWPAVRRREASVRGGIVAAAEETAVEIERGTL